MLVRIKSGNQVGAIVEMSTVEAQNNIATGYAEPFVETPEEAPKAAVTQPPRLGAAARRAASRAAAVLEPAPEDPVTIEVDPD